MARLAVGAVALLVVGLAALGLTRPDRGPSSEVTRSSGPARRLTTLATVVSTVQPATPATTGFTITTPHADTSRLSPPDCPSATGQLLADTDGDGCAESLHYGEGILVSGGSRWSVGADGDVVATGDWTCRGEAVLAVLRPATGDIFVFDGWAPADRDLVATAVARVEGGFALRAAELGDGGCQRLVVDRRDGGPVTVPIGAGE
jgi:hypothetical protein